MSIADPPVLSVCVPTLGRHDLIARLARSLAEHTASDYELIVVDNGSRPRGFTRPMNQALRAGRGQVLVGLNDDVQATPGWDQPLVAEILAGTPVCFPDQTSTDGHQCICGWAVAFDRDWFHEWGGYDERYTLWCSDIDLARHLHHTGHPPVRVPIPVPLLHDLGATQARPDLHPVLDSAARADLDAYQAKWGTRAEVDKHALAQ